MNNLQSNIDEIRKIINEKSFDAEIANEFLDAIEENIKDAENETIYDLRNDLQSSESRVDELLTEIEELKEAPTEFEIDCGIGTIEYNADNLQLQELMEALEQRIKESNPLKVLRILQPLVTA